MDGSIESKSTPTTVNHSGVPPSGFFATPDGKRPDAQRLHALVEMHSVIPSAVLAKEVELMPVKWPGYRFMSPREATTLFTMIYRQAVKNYFKANVDIESAERIQPAKNLRSDTNNAHYTQMWKARQHADELGLPYEFYLRVCFDFYGRRTRKATPQPNQLRPNVKANDAWMSLLEEQWINGGARFIWYGGMDPMPQYFRDNYSALPAQRAFHDDLYAISKSSGNLNTFISRRVFELRQLSPADCVAVFGEEVSRRAAEISESDFDRGLFKILTYQPVERTELWQACYGMVGIDRAASEICRCCPQQKSCVGMANLVTKQVASKHGTIDPVLAQKRAASRARTAKSRAKKKGRFPNILDLIAKNIPPTHPEIPG